MPTLTTRRFKVQPITLGVDASTSAWINAVIAAGGSVTSTQQGRVDTLIKALKSHSLWTPLDRLWLFAGESSTQQATIDIIALASNTNHGLALNNAGYLGDGTSTYLDTGFDPTVGTPDFGRYAGAYGFYNMTSNTASRPNEKHGQYTQSIQSGAAVNMAGNYGINDGTLATFSFTNAQGFYVIWRTDDTHKGADHYYTGGPGNFTSTETTIGAPAALTFHVNGMNLNGAPSGYNTDRTGAFFIGAINSTQGAQLSTDLNAYMTAWGVNVY